MISGGKTGLDLNCGQVSCLYIPSFLATAEGSPTAKGKTRWLVRIHLLAGRLVAFDMAGSVDGMTFMYRITS
jgi:hypothetical protein